MSDLRGILMEIRERHGKLTPTIVRDEARPKGHPLHGRVFDRPPKDAAEAWYLSRAQEVITEVRVRYSTPSGSHDLRAFHAVRPDPDDPRGGYVYEPAEEVAGDPFLRELVLRDMERDWQVLRSRYDGFVEFVEMVRRDVAV